MTDLTPGELRRGYGPIYRKLSRCGTEFSSSGKLVFIELLERLGQNATVWPLQSTIATDCGISERQVRISLRELEDIGFVTWSRRGLGKSNEYTLNLTEILRWCSSRAAESAEQERQNLPNNLLIDEDPPREDPPMKVGRETRPRRHVVPMTDEQMTKLRVDYGGLDHLDQRIEEALAHPSFAKWSNEYLYLRGWLRRDLAKLPGYRAGRGTPGQPTATLGSTLDARKAAYGLTR